MVIGVPPRCRQSFTKAYTSPFVCFALACSMPDSLQTWLTGTSWEAQRISYGNTELMWGLQRLFLRAPHKAANVGWTKECCPIRTGLILTKSVSTNICQSLTVANSRALAVLPRLSPRAESTQIVLPSVLLETDDRQLELGHRLSPSIDDWLISINVDVPIIRITYV